MKVSRVRAPGRKPKLGQHFLTDTAAAVRIVESLGDLLHHTVLEIGPGRGALTNFLARRARRVIAIEKDRVLAAQLRMHFSQTPNVEIIEGDILAIDFDSLLGPKPGSTRPGMELLPEKVQVLGNLPYFITSDILLRLFEYRKYFEVLVLMVQKEVADRLTAKPGNKEYGLLSATAQLYTKVEKVFTLPPSAFSPPPKVHSTVVRMQASQRLEKLHVDEKGFIDLLKLSFAQKRKTLWNNLKLRYPTDELERALASARVKPSTRAEALSLETSAHIFRELNSSGNNSRPA
jgi:16S rRNA (adenine1518-N6/adenine1519-N6)-dimethyltransferase